MKKYLLDLKKKSLQVVKLSCNHFMLLCVNKQIYTAYLSENLSRAVRLAIKEVQDVAGPLDAVFSRLFSGAETVVPVAMEILKAGAAVLQLVWLPWDYSLLLRYTASQEVACYNTQYLSTNVLKVPDCELNRHHLTQA